MATKKKTASKGTPGEDRFVATGKGVNLITPGGGAKKTPAKKKGGK